MPDWPRKVVQLWGPSLLVCIIELFMTLMYYRMRAALDELAPGNGIKMKLSEDGSGRGAAIVAAVACRLAQTGEYK